MGYSYRLSNYRSRQKYEVDFYVDLGFLEYSDP
jgi:hypothetical protein